MLGDKGDAASRVPAAGCLNSRTGLFWVILGRFGWFSLRTHAQGWDRGFRSHLRVSHVQDDTSLTTELSPTAAC